MNAAASTAASSMCWIRMRSAAFILRQSGRNNLGAKRTAKILRRPQVHLAAKDFRQFHFHSGERKQARHVARIEFYQDVQIAFGPEARRQHRAEQRKLTYVVPFAELFQEFLGYGDRK